jgi:hypothetical protein
MGSFDTYCAICGGPLVADGLISEKPHARSRRHRSRPSNGAEGSDQQSGIDSDDQDSSQSMDEDDEDYDCGIVSQDDASWLGTLHVLGYNPDTSE